MNFEPQKLFIGLIDFFSVLLPGAVLAYLGKDWAAAQLGAKGFPLDSPENGAVFLVASYLLGHLAFILGSKLDDWLYEPVRSATAAGSIARLAKGERPRCRCFQWLAGLLFGKEPDVAVTRARYIKEAILRKLSAEKAINTYQWSKARLSKENPSGLAAVERFEADSKFFRSFAVVLVPLLVVYLTVSLVAWWWPDEGRQTQWIPSLVCAVALPFALWRYADQRFKATQQAYYHVITLEGASGWGSAAATPLAPPDNLTHAGGVVYDGKGENREYLLVRSSNNNEWVLPKGHIEAGEDPREAAVREVKEETDCLARVAKPLGDQPLKVDGANILVRFYLMEAHDRGVCAKTVDREPSERKCQWFKFAAAVKEVTSEEAKALLKDADRTLTEQEQQRN